MSQCLILATALLLARGDQMLRSFNTAEIKISDHSILQLNAVRDDPVQETYEPIDVDGESVTPTPVMQALKPRVGTCYVSDPNLLNSVRLWRERKPDLAIKLLERIVQSSSNLELVAQARHLTIEIAEMHDMYAVIKENAEAILERSPNNTHARFVMALYHSCAHDLKTRLKVDAHKAKVLESFQDEYQKKEEDEPWWKALEDASDTSPHFLKVLREVRATAIKSWEGTTPQGNTPIEDLIKDASLYPGGVVIGIFGWGPLVMNETSEEYEGSPPMMERIEAGLQLAQAFPKAQIIASGDVDSGHKVGCVYIKEELVKRDATLKHRIIVDKKARNLQGNALFIHHWMKNNAKDATLFIVGNDWQNPRLEAIMVGTFELMKTAVAIKQVKAGSAYLEDKDLNDHIIYEQTAIWRDAARARGLFEDCVFEDTQRRREERRRQRKEQIRQRQRTSKFIAILVGVVVVLFACCVAAACYHKKKQVRNTVSGRQGLVTETELEESSAKP